MKKMTLEQFAVDYFENMLNAEGYLDCEFCPLRASCDKAIDEEFCNDEHAHTCREWLNRNMDW